MSEEPKNDKEFEPNWDKIKNLSNELDKVIDKGIEDKMNFLEIDISMYMVSEKIRQEKHKVLNDMFAEYSNEKPEKSNHFYG